MESHWLRRCSGPHIQNFHTSALRVKAVEFPPLNCAALSPQMDGSSFAKKDGQCRLCLRILSLTLGLGCPACLLGTEFCRKREHLEALISLCKDCPELRTGLWLQ